MTAPDPVVLTQRVGSTLLVTLNRPEDRNAIDLAMATAVEAAMIELDADPDLRVGVIAATGTAFCAGMDLKAFLRGERSSTARGFAGLTARPPDRPLIAAVEGVAAGGGFEIVLACDLVVASTSARFALPEVKRGLMAAGGGLLRLPGRVSHTTAMEWILTGAFVDAATAYERHLVNRLVPVGAAVAEALALAEVIGRNAPLSLIGSKAVVTQMRDWPSAEAFARQRELAQPVRASWDAREGAQAFVDRRDAVWRGA
jgi:enoyl-CoA hydratase